MKNILRTSFAVLALTLAAQVPAHAQDLCIPLLTCTTTDSGSNGDTSTDCPEISGNMISVSLALVAGVAAMMPRRRRSTSTRIGSSPHP